MRVAPPAAFTVMVSLLALGTLVLMAAGEPGCTGPASRNPCDWLAKFKEGAASVRTHSPYFAVEVLDLGSSAYATHVAPANARYILHTPGVLIDKKSCRICQADYYATRGGDEGLPLIARYPAERELPMSGPDSLQPPLTVAF